MNRAISVAYAYKKDGTKGERHGDAAERMLAAQRKTNSVSSMQLDRMFPGENIRANSAAMFSCSSRTPISHFYPNGSGATFNSSSSSSKSLCKCYNRSSFCASPGNQCFNGKLLSGFKNFRRGINA